MTTTTANTNTINMAEKQFVEDIEILKTSGAAAKKAFQRAMRHATKCALYRRDLSPVNQLLNELSTLESNYYYRLVKSNFAIYCGDFAADFNGKVTKFYAAPKAALGYNPQAKKVNFTQKATENRLSVMKKHYEKYCIGSCHFATMNIVAYKRDMTKKLEKQAFQLAVRLAGLYRSRAVWEKRNFKHKNFLVKLAQLGQEFDKELDKIKQE